MCSDSAGTGVVAQLPIEGTCMSTVIHSLPGDAHAGEVAAGERFEFGANWARFLTLLNEERIVQA